MQKQHMVPLRKGGETTVHKGKGAMSARMPNRSEIKKLSAPGGSMNDYAKASPAPQPMPMLGGPTDFGG